MITSIRLQNFRSYDDEAFDFEPGVNIIIGPNGSGKTNLLEALLVSCTGKSYRTKDIDLIAHSKDWARIDAYKETSDQRVIKLKKYGEGTSKNFEIDEKPLKRLMMIHTLPAVLFEPNQLQLLTTSPDQRRQFIDELLEQTDPLFIQDKRNYVRSLAQRNRLLKTRPADVRNDIFVWNVRLSELGAKIVKKRLELLKKFNKNMTPAYQALAGSKERLTLTYISKHSLDNYASDLLKKYEQNIDKELMQGYTLYGPHRDDIKIELNGRPIQTNASRGEVRTILLGLKMQEVELVTASRSARPILLLDDVFGELDGRRRRALTEFLSSYQTFITTTDADIVVKNFKHINPIALSSKKK